MVDVRAFMERMPSWHFPSVIVGFLIGLSITYILIDSYDECMPQGVCLYQSQLSGTNITGNCKDLLPILRSEESGTKQITETSFASPIFENDVPLLSEGVVINVTHDQFNTLNYTAEKPYTRETTPEEKPNCTQCPTCPEQIKCPETSTCFSTIEERPNNKTLDCLNKWRPKAENTIWQDGASAAIQFARECAGAKAKMFNGQRILNTPLVGSIGWEKKETDTGLECFRIQLGSPYGFNGVGVFINESVFVWNNTFQYWDTVNISNNVTWVETHHNLSGNIFIRRR